MGSIMGNSRKRGNTATSKETPLVITGEEILLPDNPIINTATPLVEVATIAEDSLPPLPVVEVGVSPSPTLVETSNGEIGIHTPQPVATPVATPAAVTPTTPLLPLASEEFPPVGMLSGIPRDACNCKVNHRNYRLLATMKKHRGSFLTANDWESLANKTYREVAKGNFAGYLKCLIWFAFSKSLQSGVVMKEGNLFGIPAA